MPKEVKMEQAKKVDVIKDTSEKDKPAMRCKLVVAIDEFGMPDFKFTGNWLGKDVALIVRLVRRAYYTHNLNIRRQGHRQRGGN